MELEHLPLLHCFPPIKPVPYADRIRRAKHCDRRAANPKEKKSQNRCRRCRHKQDDTFSILPVHKRSKAGNTKECKQDD